MLIYFALAALLSLVNGQAKRMILDVDGAIDDARALVLALRFDPKVQLLAVTCTNSWVSSRQCVLNMNRVLRLLKKEDVPIYMGPNQAILSRKRESWPLNHGADALGDRPDVEPLLDEKIVIPDENAPMALVRLSKQFPGEITIVSGGPLTNLAIAQKLDPYFGSRLKEVYMNGGNMFGVGLMPTNPSAEYNFHMDPEAAYVVFTEFTTPITCLPFETASERINTEVYQLLNTPVKRDAFFYRNTTVSKFLYAINKDILKSLDEIGANFGFTDEIPVAAALNPPGVIVRSKSVIASIELHGEHTRGQVAVDWVNLKKRKNIRMITEYNPRVVAGMMLKAVDDEGASGSASDVAEFK